MIRLNLLPWREAQKERNQKRFIIAICLTAAISACLSYSVVYLHNLDLDNHVKRNDILKSEIVVLDKRIAEIDKLEDQKVRLLDRVSVIKQLQDSRPDVVRIFNVIANQVPEGVYLLNVSRENGVMTVNGVAESNARISVFMRNLDATQGLSESQLSIVEQKVKEGSIEDSVRQFTLRVTGSANDSKQEDKE